MASSVGDGYNFNKKHHVAKLIHESKEVTDTHVTQGMCWSTLTQTARGIPNAIAGVTCGRAARSPAHRVNSGCGSCKPDGHFFAASKTIPVLVSGARTAETTVVTRDTVAML